MSEYEKLGSKKRRVYKINDYRPANFGTINRDQSRIFEVALNARKMECTDRTSRSRRKLLASELQ